MWRHLVHCTSHGWKVTVRLTLHHYCFLCSEICHASYFLLHTSWNSDHYYLLPTHILTTLFTIAFPPPFPLWLHPALFSCHYLKLYCLFMCLTAQSSSQECKLHLRKGLFLFSSILCLVKSIWHIIIFAQESFESGKNGCVHHTGEARSDVIQIHHDHPCSTPSLIESASPEKPLVPNPYRWNFSSRSSTPPQSPPPPVGLFMFCSLHFHHLLSPFMQFCPWGLITGSFYSPLSLLAI